MSEAVCPACGAPLVTITIHVGAGDRTLCSCARCDKRWWRRDGELTDLQGVIGELGDPEPRTTRFRR